MNSVYLVLGLTLRDVQALLGTPELQVVVKTVRPSSSPPRRSCSYTSRRRASCRCADKSRRAAPCVLMRVHQ